MAGGAQRGGGAWRIAAADDPALIAALRSHARHDDEFEVVVGGGWRELVRECHGQLEARFPEYELLAVKQKYGRLAFQAFPRPWREDRRAWSSEEHARLDEITDAFGERSETICEWCGSAGELRYRRRWELTLCDDCDARFPDPPYPLYGKPLKRSS
jgi:hypothetical protein